MTDLDWPEFRDGLARSIAALPNGAALIVSDVERTACFVQFMLDRDRVIAEVASGLDQWDRPNLTEEETAALEQIGWSPPEKNPVLNHGVTVAWPAPSSEYRRMADMSVAALRDVFEIPSPASLRYKAFAVSGGAAVPMPRLGIPAH
ncbi:hypothetical protein ACTOB_003798 [Actinoplanes oblitus]|uniref:TY-Chap N-terminal domain-containing protein n=1 Tax=Actinoplanes oblitus TaxID=3040509 RepID=A0ABY8WQD6_9ACTN|nr:hypothetical protein [Actinoplanes oblitus]WIN00115.1 hypothetical protein ACTOB_003798 [Actinoplanes oblitus]